MVRPDRYPQVFISFLSNLHSNLSVSNVIPTFTVWNQVLRYSTQTPALMGIFAYLVEGIATFAFQAASWCLAEIGRQ